VPIHEILTKEYVCGHCHYHWIDRVNGRDGPIPIKCAKCKRANWNNPKQRIRPMEAGLRRRIKGFYNVYKHGVRTGDINRRYRIYWPADLSQKFLDIKPRPTLKELDQVVYPFGHYMRKYGDLWHRERNKEGLEKVQKSKSTTRARRDKENTPVF
jgi:hypothetical protein